VHRGALLLPLLALLLSGSAVPARAQEGQDPTTATTETTGAGSQSESPAASNPAPAAPALGVDESVQQPPEPAVHPEELADEKKAEPADEMAAPAEPSDKAESSDEAEEPEEPKDTRGGPIAFTLQLEDGQGTVTGHTGSLEFRREDYAVLSGGVAIEFRDVTLKADQAEVDLQTREVKASGDVIFDEGPRRLSGDTLTLNLDTKTGTLTEASAYVDPDYYFTGRTIEKVDENVYIVTDGVFTSCNQDVPDWSFRMGRARVEADAYAHVKNARMRIKKLPVFYTPYIVWPTKQDRSAGLLVPNIGYSARRGTYLGLAYFQPLGRSYDTTFFLDGYSKGYLGFGNELRYRPTDGTRGRFEGYIIDDDETGDTRWKVKLEHESNDLPLGMRGVIDYTDYSDFQFFQDFERDFDRNSRRFEESRAFLTGNWGTSLVNLQVTSRDTFATNRVNTDRELPSLQYRLRSTPIVTTPLWQTPIYLTVDSSAGYLSVDRSNTFQADYGRFDVFPQVSFPVEPAPWLSLNLTAGHRLTWYQDSLEEDRTVVQETGSAFSGDGLTRSVSNAGAELIGPSFSRIFETPVGGFSKFKHIIEPRVVYAYADDFEESTLVPRFDSVDSRFSGNVARVSLINRIKGKPAGEDGGGAREIVNFELRRTYSLDAGDFLERGAETLDDGAPIITSTAGPLQAILRFAPSDTTLVRADWTYSVLFKQLTSSSISASARLGRNDFGLRYTTRYRPQDGETLSNQVRLAAGVVPLPGRLALRASVDYDIEASELQEQRYFVDYTSQCYGIRLEYRDFQAGQVQDTDYRIAFTLKNVGTFLDLTGRVQ